VSNSEMAVALLAELASATGGAGMIGGEQMDLDGQTEPPETVVVERIHAAKTARLIQSACRLGSIAAGADNNMSEALSDYGWHLGLAFQAADDLLDVIGSIGEVGKATGKDADAGKQTYPRAIGVDETRARVQALTERSVEALAPLGSAGTRLAALSKHAATRRS
ncbi:MAG: polyprenyl synthetase family protein, partial [Phycisphaerae bacterium]